MTILIADSRGIPVPIEIPAGWKPQTLDFEIEWPPIFQQQWKTFKRRFKIVVAATSANLISRESGTSLSCKKTLILIMSKRSQ